MLKSRQWCAPKAKARLPPIALLSHSATLKRSSATAQRLEREPLWGGGWGADGGDHTRCRSSRRAVIIEKQFLVQVTLIIPGLLWIPSAEVPQRDEKAFEAESG